MFIFFFLLNFLILSLFGRVLSKFGIQCITLFNVINSICCVLVLFKELYITNDSLSIFLFNWFIIDGYHLNFSLNFDFLSILMISMIIVIASIVHIYSFEYMSEDPHLVRFISYLSLFTFFMLILVTSANLVQLFLGWEGVGICSYLLVNFWYLRVSANKAAIKAILVNRIGDCALLFAILLILTLTKHLDFFLLASSYNLQFFEFINFQFLINNGNQIETFLYSLNNSYNSIIILSSEYYLFNFFFYN